MGKVLVISVLNTNKNVLPFDGVMKKIVNEIDALRSYGNDVDFTENDGTNVFLNENGQKTFISKIKQTGYKCYNRILYETAKHIKKFKKKYDFIYIRHDTIIATGILALKILKKFTNKIYLEIPTFYKKDIVTIKDRIKNYFNSFLKKYVTKIVTYSLDDTIYNIPTIKINNGISVSKISPKAPVNSDTINVILVAMISSSHGINKIITALDNYYNIKNNKQKIFFHIVGDGPELEKYKTLAEEKHLSKYIKFYGKLGGADLDQAYEACELGISTLSAKENGLQYCSSLKSKEYLAKGIPVISDVDMDLFLNKPKYYFYKLKDDFNIEEIVEYYNFVYSHRDKNEIIAEIRDFAEKECEMKKIMFAIQEDYDKLESKEKR